MGRKEKLRRKTQSKLILGHQKKLSDRQFLEQEVFKLRSELSIMRSKFRETLVRITNELRKQGSNQTIFDRILISKGLICKDDAVKALSDIKEETLKMFNSNGDMVGNPEVTCYNCDFEITFDDVDVNTVKTLGSEL